jgi:hypothetical protein
MPIRMRRPPLLIGINFLKKITMKTLRTQGAGETLKVEADQRLEIIKKILIWFEITHIDMLHDHKGLLTIFWNKMPDDYEKEKIKEIWGLFNEEEIEHKMVTYNKL